MQGVSVLQLEVHLTSQMKCAYALLEQGNIKMSKLKENATDTHLLDGLLPDMGRQRIR